MTHNEILLQLVGIIRETFGIDDVEIGQETVADDIPGWDSLSNTILMLTIERAFGMEISNATTYANVGELVDYIHKSLSKNL